MNLLPKVGGVRRFGARVVPWGPAAFLVGALLAPVTATADAVTDWNQELQTLISLSSANLVDGPPEVAREMALVTASMFDAVNAASGSPYASFAYNGPSAPGVSLNAAALSAGYQAVAGIFNDQAWQSPTGAATAAVVLAQANQFYSAGLTALGVPGGNPVTGCAAPSGGLVSVCAGIGLGNAAAAAVLAKTANDGSQQAILNGLNTYTPPGSGTVPGVYVPPTTRPAMLPQWGSVAPVGITPAQVQAAAQSLPGPPSVGSQAYADALLLTECVGSGRSPPAAVQSACAQAGIAPRTAAQSAASLFWNDPGSTIQPPGHWLQITDTVIQSQNLSTLQAARLSMLLSMAEDDAGIAAWLVKYQDNLWRPITAIQNCGAGGNGTVGWSASFATCDTTWTSLIGTPPHPDYVAGHPTFSAAAVAVLTGFFGTDAIGFASTSQSYCNAGSALRGSDLGIDACLVAAGAPFSANGLPTIYTLGGAAQQQAVCLDVGGTFLGGATPSCTIGGVTYVWSDTQPSCNDVVNLGGANDSPLICPITETFSSFSDAATGPLGSEFSRITGGIHTSFAVDDGNALGAIIGGEVIAAADVSEPPAIVLLTLALGGLAWARRPARRGLARVTG